MEATAKAIRERRRALDLTQVELAIKIGRSPTTISLAERGLVSDETLERIAAALGLRPEELAS
jgi:transcriptional regulator with XRE-family HTH domain